MTTKPRRKKIKYDGVAFEKFIGILAHELRSPFSTVKLSAQMIQRQPETPDAVRKLAARTEKAIDRADRVIRDLVDVNTLQSGGKLGLELAKNDLNAVFENLIAEATGTYGQRFALHTEGPLEGMWDSNAVARIVEHLFSNAVRYGAPEKAITVHIVRRAKKVDITVHNHGAPLAAAHREKIFQMHRAADFSNEGQRCLGVGLMVSHGLAKAHGGSLTVKSTVKNGTTFTLSLPYGESKRSAQPLPARRKS